MKSTPGDQQMKLNCKSVILFLFIFAPPVQMLTNILYTCGIEGEALG